MAQLTPNSPYFWNVRSKTLIKDRANFKQWVVPRVRPAFVFGRVVEMHKPFYFLPSILLHKPTIVSWPNCSVGEGIEGFIYPNIYHNRTDFLRVIASNMACQVSILESVTGFHLSPF